jgi:hypothetical protein
MQDLQNMRDRIDNQMRQIQQQQNQIPQQVPTNLTQNFQITPQQNIANELEVKYANNIDEVKNTFVMKTGVFVTKDFSTLWIKDVSGNVRTFRTEEVVELDEKDKEIMYLKKQIEEMKGMIYSAESNTTNVDEPIPESKPTRVQTNRRTNAK